MVWFFEPQCSADIAYSDRERDEDQKAGSEIHREFWFIINKLTARFYDSLK